MLIDRDERLAGDYQELMEYSKKQKLINIRVIRGQPPEEYQVTYLCKGYIRKPTPRKVKKHVFNVSLPRGYPEKDVPFFRPQGNTIHLMHPNMQHGANYLCIGHGGNKLRPLLDYIIQVGYMIIGDLFPTGSETYLRNQGLEQPADYCNFWIDDDQKEHAVSTGIFDSNSITLTKKGPSDKTSVPIKIKKLSISDKQVPKADSSMVKIKRIKSDTDKGAIERPDQKPKIKLRKKKD